MDINTKYYVLHERVKATDQWKLSNTPPFKEPLEWSEFEDRVAGIEYRFVRVKRIGEPEVIWQHKARKLKEKVESLDDTMKKGMATMFLKMAEDINFSGMSPSKLTLPNVAGMSLEFTNPNAPPGEGDFGYVTVGDNRYKVGGFDNLKFDGVLPVWIHPMFGAMIGGILDNVKGVIKEIAGTVTDRMTGKEQIAEDFDSVLGEKVEEKDKEMPKLEEPEDFDKILEEEVEDEEIEEGEKEGELEEPEEAKEKEERQEELEGKQEKEEKEEESEVEYHDKFEEFEEVMEDEKRD